MPSSSNAAAEPARQQARGAPSRLPAGPHQAAPAAARAAPMPQRKRSAGHKASVADDTRSAGGTKAAAAGTKPIAADTAGSQNSSQDKRQQTAQAYLARLQEALPSAAYQQLMKHLQQYRKDHDTLKVTDGVLDLLRLPSRRHLLLDFAKFLRSQDRDWFLRCVK